MNQRAFSECFENRTDGSDFSLRGPACFMGGSSGSPAQDFRILGVDGQKTALKSAEEGAVTVVEKLSRGRKLTNDQITDTILKYGNLESLETETLRL